MILTDILLGIVFVWFSLDSGVEFLNYGVNKQGIPYFKVYSTTVIQPSNFTTIPVIAGYWQDVQFCLSYNIDSLECLDEAIDTFYVFCISSEDLDTVYVEFSNY